MFAINQGPNEGIVDKVEEVNVQNSDYVSDPDQKTGMVWNYDVYFNATTPFFKGLFNCKTANRIPYSPDELKYATQYGLPVFTYTAAVPGVSNRSIGFRMPTMNEQDDSVSSKWFYTNAGADVFPVVDTQALLAAHRLVRDGDHTYKIAKHIGVLNTDQHAAGEIIENDAINAMADLFATSAAYTPPYNEPDLWRKILRPEMVRDFVTANQNSVLGTKPTDNTRRIQDVLFQRYEDKALVEQLDPTLSLLQYWQRKQDPTVFDFDYTVQARYREFHKALGVHLQELLGKFNEFASDAQFVAVLGASPTGGVVDNTFGQVYYNVLKQYYVMWDKVKATSYQIETSTNVFTTISSQGDIKMQEELRLRARNPFVYAQTDTTRMNMVQAAKLGKNLDPSSSVVNMLNSANLCPAFANMLFILVPEDVTLVDPKINSAATVWQQGLTYSVGGGTVSASADSVALSRRLYIQDTNLWIPRATEFKYILALGSGLLDNYVRSDDVWGGSDNGNTNCSPISNFTPTELKNQFAYPLTKAHDVSYDWEFVSPDSCLKFAQFVRLNTKVLNSGNRFSDQTWKVSICADADGVQLSVFDALHTTSSTIADTLASAGTGYSVITAVDLYQLFSDIGAVLFAIVTDYDEKDIAYAAFRTKFKEVAIAALAAAKAKFELANSSGTAARKKAYDDATLVNATIQAFPTSLMSIVDKATEKSIYDSVASYYIAGSNYLVAVDKATELETAIDLFYNPTSSRSVRTGTYASANTANNAVQASTLNTKQKEDAATMFTTYKTFYEGGYAAAAVLLTTLDTKIGTFNNSASSTVVRTTAHAAATVNLANVEASSKLSDKEKLDARSSYYSMNLVFGGTEYKGLLEKVVALEAQKVIFEAATSDTATRLAARDAAATLNTDIQNVPSILSNQERSDALATYNSVQNVYSGATYVAAVVQLNKLAAEVSKFNDGASTPAERNTAKTEAGNANTAIQAANSDLSDKQQADAQALYNANFT